MISSLARLPPLVVGALGIGVLTVMDALIKHLAATFPTLQIVFMRFAFGAIFLAVGAAAWRLGWPRRERLRAHAGRAVLIVLAGSSFFFALGRLELAEVFALSFTAPIFVALFGAMFLGERVGARAALAIALGFAGMVVIVLGGAGGGSGGRDVAGLIAAFIAPLCHALGVVLLRAQTAHEPVAVIIMVQAALVALFVAPVVAIDHVAPDATQWLLFAAVGALGAAGYLAFAQALSRLPAARFAVVEYTGLIWAALIGYAVFAETPSPALWLGAALIIAGCLAVLRERAR